jgi:hypothetical protein
MSQQTDISAFSFMVRHSVTALSKQVVNNSINTTETPDDENSFPSGIYLST